MKDLQRKAGQPVGLTTENGKQFFKIEVHGFCELALMKESLLHAIDLIHMSILSQSDNTPDETHVSSSYQLTNLLKQFSGIDYENFEILDNLNKV